MWFIFVKCRAPQFSRLFAALRFHKNLITPFQHQALQFTVYTSCYNSNMHGCLRSINPNAFKRILVNKRTIHYEVTTQNFLSDALLSLRITLLIYRLCPFINMCGSLPKPILIPEFPWNVCTLSRVGRSAKEFVVSNLVTSSPTKSPVHELLFQL